MKNKITIAIILIIAASVLVFNYLRAIEITPSELQELMGQEVSLGATILYPSGGGTGTSTNPSYGKILVGTSGGVYQLQATSTLGITASQVYPGAGIALSTGSAWDTSITNNSGNWNTAYTNASTSLYSILVSRNSWTTIDNYPSACSAGQYVSAVGDTLTCATPAGGSGVGTISTSTSPTIGNLAYWTSKDAWPETLGTVATTTLTGTAPIVFSNPISVIGASASAVSCTAASGSVAGCLSAANWNTFNNKWDLASSTIGNAYLTNSTISGVALGSNLAALTNDATLNGSSYNGSGAISDWGLNLANANTWTALQTFNNATTTLLSASYASSTLGYFGTAYIPTLGTAAGTFLAVNANGQIIATSTPSGSGTVTNIATTYPITGGPITTTGTLALAFGTTTANTWGDLQTFGNASTTQLSIDATTGKLYIPATTDPSISATGQIAINTTAASSSLRFYNGTAERALSDIISRTITVASTTLWNATATTTIPIGVSLRGETWVRTACFSDLGTAAVQFGNGTASTSYISVSTTLANTTQTNTFTLYQKRYMDIGKLASSPNYISCSIYYRETAD